MSDLVKIADGWKKDKKSDHTISCVALKDNPRFEAFADENDRPLICATAHAYWKREADTWDKKALASSPRKGRKRK
jgi:hypothetical protein